MVNLTYNPSFEEEFENNIINYLWSYEYGENFDFNIFTNNVRYIIDYCIKYRIDYHKKERILWELFITIIKKIWLVFNDDLIWKYYFNNLNKELYNIDWEKFKIFMSNLIWITQTNKYFKICFLKLSEVASQTNIKIQKHSFFDIDNKVMFLFNNDNKIIKIDKNAIKIIENWEDWIIFEKNPETEVWDYNWNNEDEDIIDKLTDSISFSNDSFEKEEYKVILKTYFYSLYFWSFLNNKPIISFIWSKWSWKSYFLGIIKKIFTGNFQSGLFSFPDNSRDLKTNLIRNSLAFYDNVDSKILNKDIDVICQATGWDCTISSRKLYSDNQEVKAKVLSFVAFTSRNPKFLRDDVNDRLLPIEVKRRNEYDWEGEKLLKNLKINYSSVMSSICNTIQKKLYIFENYEAKKLNLRMIEFWNFMYNFNKDKTSINDIYKIVEKIVRIQKELSNSNDEILDILNDIFKFKNQSLINPETYYTASELHQKFFNYSKRNPHLKYSKSNSTDLWIHISHRIREYSDENIRVTVSDKRTWNKKRYKIEKIITT